MLKMKLDEVNYLALNMLNDDELGTKYTTSHILEINRFSYHIVI